MDIGISAPYVEKIEMIEGIRGPSDVNDTLTSDVERADFAALGEIGRSELRACGQRKGTFQRHSHTDYSSIQIHVSQLHGAGLIKTADQERVAKVLRCHVRITQWIRHQDRSHGSHLTLFLTRRACQSGRCCNSHCTNSSPPAKLSD